MHTSPVVKRSVSVRVLSALATFCLLATGCASTDGQGLGAEIDRPAVDKVLPPDAVVDVQRDYGAAGDGVTDDTGAIQAAISAGLGFASTRKLLYFPAGTYLISRPLTWQRADGRWDTWLTLQGANRDKTVIQLAPHANGFQDPASPRSIIVTGSQNAYGPDGSGNQAFHNFIFDLTIDVGIDNPGANGIDYLANNRGAIRNVVVRAPTGSGNDGISMLRKYSGPAILENVHVIGFSRGLQLGQPEYSMVAEHLRLAGQRQVGIEVMSNVLTIRDLISDNKVTAVRSGSSIAQGSLLTLVDSVLAGGDSRTPAVENYGAMVLRGVRTAGYGSGLRDHGRDRRVDPDGDTSYPATAGGRASLDIASEEEPEVPNYSLDDWAGVSHYGARASDGHDDTIGIQAALDSGKPVIYFGAGRYRVSKTLHVPETVRLIAGLDAQMTANLPGISASSGAPVFSIVGFASQPLTMSKFDFVVPAGTVDIERTATRTLDLQDIHFSATAFRGGAGSLFLNDVAAAGDTWTFTPGQKIWARQLNVEQKGLKLLNDGAQVWVLGLKTELPSTVLRNTNGANTEILGGLLYAVQQTSEDEPAFVDVGGSMSLTFATSAYRPDRNYNVLVDQSNSFGKYQLTAADTPKRGDGSLVTLYQTK